jgi:NET1-associated nuclear protein 1 (U3 small nucleolar RNA-associated protein 17)
MESAYVEQMTISQSGLWMATVDRREGGTGFRGEVYLKIWQWDGSDWILNTRIDEPHGYFKVSHVSFSPDSTYLVTTGEDLNIKTWTLWRSKDGSDGTFNSP